MKKNVLSIVILAMLFSICNFMVITTTCSATAYPQLQSDPISSTKAYGRRNMLVFQSEVTAGSITSASGIGTTGAPPFSVDRPVLLADGLLTNQFYDSATTSIVYDGVSYKIGSMTEGEGQTGDAVFVNNTATATSFTTKIATQTQSAYSDPTRTSSSYDNFGGTLTFTDASSGYDKVSFMASSTGGYWNTIVASVRYTDGTFEEVMQFMTVPLTGTSTWDKINPMKTIYINGGTVEPYFNTNISQKYIDALADAIGAKAIIPFTQVQWLSSANNIMGMTIPTQSSNFGGTGNNTAYVGIYDVPVDPAKTVKAIDFYKVNADAVVTCLGGEGVTSITGSGTSSIAHALYTDPDNSSSTYDATMKVYRGNYGPYVLSATLYNSTTTALSYLINRLPDEVNEGNVKDAYEVVKMLEELIENENLSLADIDPVMNNKYLQVKASFNNYFLCNQLTIDRSSNEGVAIFDNFTDTDKSAMIILAEYKGSKLIGTKLSTVQILKGTEDVQKTLEYIPQDLTSTIKMFVWENTNMIKPMIKFAEYESSIVFIGDSITHGGYYLMYAETFNMTRSPNTSIEFKNAGIAGNTAASAIARYSWDIQNKSAGQATIMFGANDVNRALYDGTNSNEAEKATKIADCLTNIRTLVGMLKADQVNDIILITPPMYDERSYTGATATFNMGVNGALGLVSDGVKVIGEDNNLTVVDFYSRMNTVTNSLPLTDSLFGTDRLHPTQKGHFVMMYELVKAMGFNDTVSYLNFDVADSSKNSYTNADVVSVTSSASGLSYTYIPKSIPMAVDSYYTACDGNYINFTDEMNKEIIKVSGLSNGSYKIYFGEQLLTTVTSDELQSGVNIAVLATNPGQVKAKTVLSNNLLKYNKEYLLRNIAFAEQLLMNAHVYGDDVATAAYIQTQNDNPTLSITIKNVLNSYYTNKANESSYQSDISNYTKLARAAAQPEAYSVRIVPAD